MRRWGFSATVVAGIVALAGIVAWDGYQQAHFVTTSYASVEAPVYWITASDAGIIDRVVVHLGQTVHQGQAVAVVRTTSGALAVVHAPSAGVVGGLAISPGFPVAPKQNLLVLIHKSQLRVLANVPENHIKDVATGDTATMTFSAYPGQRFSGQVVHIGGQALSINPAVISSGTTFSKSLQWIPVVLRVNAPNAMLRPGENATVKIQR